MSATPSLASLRETLRAIEGDGHRRRPVLPFGMGAIDGRLASTGLRLDALVARPVYYELANLALDAPPGPVGAIGLWSDGAFFALGPGATPA